MKETPYTWTEKFESFERINSIREKNRDFDSCNSCKQLVPSRLHEMHESKFPFVSRMEFIRSKLSNFFCSCIRGQRRTLATGEGGRRVSGTPVGGVEGLGGLGPVPCAARWRWWSAAWPGNHSTLTDLRRKGHAAKLLTAVVWCNFGPLFYFHGKKSAAFQGASSSE